MTIYAKKFAIYLFADGYFYLDRPDISSNAVLRDLNPILMFNLFTVLSLYMTINSKKVSVN